MNTITIEYKDNISKILKTNKGFITMNQNKNTGIPSVEFPNKTFLDEESAVKYANKFLDS